MTCEKVCDLLYLLITDELEEAEAAQAYSHMVDCAECRQALAEHVRLNATLSTLMPGLSEGGGFEC